ncbi:MAG: hypothetical protein D3905_04725 [Candidatus Electrothrix sp. AS4_5]|nr:hypothetical protein [Candidatus Electrothrix gigas]
MIMSFQSLHRASISHLRRLKGTLQKYKQVLGITVTFIGLLASIIAIFVFLTGIQSCPDAIKKLWYDSVKDTEPSATFYTVKLLLPARMSGAKILVDSQPAVIVQQAPTVVTVQVKQKNSSHQFTVRKGESVCTQQQLIRENNVIIHPCQ